MGSFKEIIQQMLTERAAQEPEFAPKLANPNKNIDDCIKYIYGEVLAKYVKGHGSAQAAAVPREEVFGLAVHYYDEENVTIRSLSGARVKTAPKSSEAKQGGQTTTNKAKTPKKPIKREKQDVKPAIEEDFAGTLFDESMFV